MNHSNDAAARLILEAADWSRALGRAPDKDVWNAFDEWVRTSPAHLRCFLEQSALDDALRRSGFATQHSVEEWVALGRQGDDDEEDEDVEATTPAVAAAHAAHRAAPTTWGMRALALAGAVALGLAIALFSWWQPWSWNDYAFADTTRPITLTDGSEIHPYAGSQLKVREEAQSREVRVVKEGASFEVHHDPRQTFRVQARNATVEAIGTVFNVLIKGQRTGIYVAEGGVLVRAGKNSLTLSEGQSADVTASGQIDLVQPPAPVASAGAGAVSGAVDSTMRLAEFTFGEMADALNRHNRVPQFVVTGAARDERALAPQHLDDPEKWLRVLSGYEELLLERQGHTVTIRLRGDRSR